MGADRDHTAGQAGRRPSRWSQILLYTAAGVMLAAGASTLLWNHMATPAKPEVTGRIMPGLEPADHIAASPGVLCDWNVLI
ncbi:MAG: hypothetical protein KAV82_16775, partial [Phycisphaerae bacterium]|nr:hypothetical protein [Phycisphaerae bacterium]